MKIEQAGIYRTLEPIKMHGPNSNGTIGKGLLLTISQVDIELGVVLGPALPGWQPADMPVEKVED